MRSLSLAALTAGWCLGLCGADRVAAQEQDLIGVWFDSAAQIDTLATTAAYEVVTGYLVIRNPSSPYAISGWEGIVEVAGEGIIAAGWTLSAGLNIDEAPRFQVGIDRYQALPVGPAVVLATARLIVASPQSHGWIYVHPYDPASLQDPPGSGNPVSACVYTSIVDPEDLRRLAWSSGEEAFPVAVINPGTAEPVCHPSTDGLRFGNVPVGGAREKVLVLANVGGSPANVEVPPPPVSDFRVVSGGGALTLAPGARHEVRVRYEPAAAGPQTTALSACGEVDLTGAGYLSGVCVVAPTAIEFGEVRQGEEACRTFSLTNPSALDVQGELGDLNPPFRFAAGGGSFYLQPGQSREVTVCFAPTDLGPVADSVVVSGCDALVALQGSGIEGPPICAVTPSELDFGTRAAGDVVVRSFVVRNAGGGLLSGVVGDVALPFAVVAGSGPFQLAAQESLLVTVSYSPTAAGQHVADVDLGLAGCGPVACAGGVPSCAANTGTLVFGEVVVGESLVRELTVRNAGGGVLSGTVSLSAPAFSLPAAPSGVLPYQLAAGQTLLVRVRFAPTVIGFQEALLQTGDGCGTVVLQGMGVELQPICQLSRDSLDFGAVAVGASADRSFTVHNAGPGVLAGEISEDGAEFTLVYGGGPFTLGSGASRYVTVRYAPTSSGTHTCTVTTGTTFCSTVACTGTGLAPACELQPASLDFGAVAPGQSRDISFVIRNTGPITFAGNVALTSSDFLLVSGGGVFSLPAGQQRTVTVRFRPAAPGIKSCTVTTGSVCGDVPCQGAAAFPQCRVEPAVLDFGLLAVGGRADRTFAVTNDGSVSFTVAPSENCAMFSLVEGGFATILRPGQSQAITVRCAPTAPGDMECTVVLGTACGGVLCRAQAVTVQCRVTPDLLDFGTVLAGQTADLPFTVANDGPLAVSGTIAVTGSADFSLLQGGGAFVLEAGQTREVVVRFRPTGDGPRSATVSTGLTCGAVACRGVAQGGPPQCRVEPAVLDFGTVLADQTADLPFTVANDGPLAASGTVAVTGSADFSLLQGGGAFVLEAGQTRDVVVRFRPTGDGPRSATVSTDLLCGAVDCRGVAQSGLPLCEVFPAQLDFGWLILDDVRDLNVTIRNAGGGTLAGRPRLSGAAFAIMTGGGDYLLGPGQSRIVSVRFDPPAAGAHAGYLDPGGGCEVVPCLGTATAGDLDCIGIFFDTRGEMNQMSTAAPYQSVTAYLAVIGPSQRTGISGWECCVEIAGNVLDPVWSCEGGGLNVAAPPCFQVGIPGYALPWRSVVVLATVRLVQESPQEQTLFFIHPYTIPSLPGTPVYAAGHDPEVLVPLRWSSGSESVPVAWIGPGTGPTSVGTPPPAAIATGGGVTVRWRCTLPDVDGFHVYRRVDDGMAQRRTEWPLAPGPLFVEFVDDVAGLAPGAALRYCYAALRDGAEIARSGETTLLLAATAPKRTCLRAVYPNPFNPTAQVQFEVAQPGRVRLEIFDLAGRRIRVLCDETLPAGGYGRQWDGRDERGQAAPSGTYYVRLSGDEFVDGRTVTLLK